jgi:hypothetical protein
MKNGPEKVTGKADLKKSNLGPTLYHRKKWI